MNVICKGLDEPYAKRTVEGDIGMRYSVAGIVSENRSTMDFGVFRIDVG